MASHTNALSELTRFWLEQRHGCLVRESVPVPVPYNQSDIDMLALRLDGKPMRLPSGDQAGPRVIVETKDEHDWEPLGREFAKLVMNDISLLSEGRYVAAKTKGVKFTMLRQEHFEVASKLFGSDDFDRLFVVHVLDPSLRPQIAERMRSIRVYWMTASELVRDLESWYRAHSRASGLRNSLVGDLLHLLWGFCEFSLPERRS
jgi:hypothetical protein